MKRFAIFALIGLFLLIGRAEAGDLKTYLVANATAARAKTQIAVTTIIPGKDVILGFRLMPGGASTDPIVYLHDAASTATQTTTSGGTMFDALETGSSPLSSEVAWYPKPKHLSLGMSVDLGPYMMVVIFYERVVN